MSWPSKTRSVWLSSYSKRNQASLTMDVWLTLKGLWNSEKSPKAPSAWPIWNEFLGMTGPDKIADYPVLDAPWPHDQLIWLLITGQLIALLSCDWDVCSPSFGQVAPWLRTAPSSNCRTVINIRFLWRVENLTVWNSLRLEFVFCFPSVIIVTVWAIVMTWLRVFVYCALS